jgi:hypothetical protein
MDAEGREFVVIGPHGAMTRWVFDIVDSLVSRCPGKITRMIDKSDAVNLMTAPQPVYLTYYPSPSLIDAIDRGFFNVLLVVEDPPDVAAYLQAALGLPFMEAIRSQTASAVANLTISQANVLHIDRASERSAGQTVARIADHLAPSLGMPSGWWQREQPGAINDVIDQATGGGGSASVEDVLAARGDHYAPPLRGRSAAATPDDLLAREVIDPLIGLSQRGATRPVVWPTAVFKFTGNPDGPAPQTADVTEIVRTIYYGPYFYLPPARYRVEAVLGFSEEIKDLPFVMEMHGSRWLTNAKIDRRRAGEYRGYFMLDHRESAATLEIRLRNDAGVPHGRLSLFELLFFVIR